LLKGDFMDHAEANPGLMPDGTEPVRIESTDPVRVESAGFWQPTTRGLPMPYTDWAGEEFDYTSVPLKDAGEFYACFELGEPIRPMPYDFGESEHADLD
jgi:hypothetical protein